MSSEKVAVVTGSNKGIGFGIVRQLCQEFDGIVYLTARDTTRGNAAVAELEKDGLKAVFFPLDIDNLDSIKGFRRHLQETHGGFDILVNNAAIAFKNSATEPFGVQAEETVRVNYFGTLNVCNELFPLLRKHARIVHMSSYAGLLNKIAGKEPAAMELKKRFAAIDATEDNISELAHNFVQLAQDGSHNNAGWPNSTYIVSKVALSALVPIQQRFFNQTRPDDDIIVNCINPGFVDTDMSSHMGKITVEEASQTPVYLALLPPNIRSPRGQFVWYDRAVVDWINSPIYKD